MREGTYFQERDKKTTMCGVVGILADRPVNQQIYDALLLLQHRGQDAAGIGTMQGDRFALFKAKGLVSDIFRTRDMRNLVGNAGIGHVRYPTQGCASDNLESQPFYVNAPFGILFAHNGNLTNAREIKERLAKIDHRHTLTMSDSEVLLNVFADALAHETNGKDFCPEALFRAVGTVHKIVQGSYACVALIAGHGLVAFRDPHAIRPLCFGTRTNPNGRCDTMFSSESVTMGRLGFTLVRDVAPGEAVFVDTNGTLYSHVCADDATLNPCAFEYIYFARPESVIDKINVYAARLKLGQYLARAVAKRIDVHTIDCVIPIPDTGRPAAQELAGLLGLNYREGFIKNRYVGRTFIMPDQATRKKSVRQKLNAMPVEFAGKSVLLVDDSIVRGTTMGQIVDLARQSGAKKVYVASTAPRVMFPNVYGIDIPSCDELICGHGEDEREVARRIGADDVIYLPLPDLTRALQDLNPEIQKFDCSCFDGDYVAGNVAA